MTLSAHTPAQTQHSQAHVCCMTSCLWEHNNPQHAAVPSAPCSTTQPSALCADGCTTRSYSYSPGCGWDSTSTGSTAPLPPAPFTRGGRQRHRPLCPTPLSLHPSPACQIDELLPTCTQHISMGGRGGWHMSARVCMPQVDLHTMFQPAPCLHACLLMQFTFSHLAAPQPCPTPGPANQPHAPMTLFTKRMAMVVP